MNIRANVKKARAENDLLQSELAEKVGVSQAMINQIESGVKIPSLAVSIELAKALNKTLDWLTS